ncbi:hypothetical protein Ddye_030079 [Dipteronia dyeriana]|uniref:Protein kinase domain-containing protein n=1 Tax=Dipteronia dyeriana TaxID=168575 RepID=A0AAD9TFS5_9ROSI|nr:hypothetical protein Ddye_030079 [Dipteronia dyeriana]
MSHVLLIAILFLLLPYTEAKRTSDGNTTSEFCPLPTRCAPKGPNIRFPFRLETQPAFCGLEGFELSCFNNNTLLQLPSSTNNSYYVQEISYVDNTVTIMDVNDTTCPLQSLLSLNLTNSKSFLAGSNDIAVVKCTEKINTTTRETDQSVRPRTFDYWSYTKQVVGPIDCMSDDKVFVYVVSSMASMDMMPSTCRTSQTASIISFYADQIQNTVMTILRTRRIVVDWKAPDGCIDCENHGNFCGFNFTINSTACFKQKDSHGPKVPILVIIGTSVGGTIFFTLVMLVIYKSRKSDKGKETQLKVEKFLEDYKILKPARYTYGDLKKITSKFKHKLGQGGYGSVYKGKLSNGIPVAVKVFEGSEGNGHEFINEVATIGRIHHFNIVRLLGFCSEGTRRAIIYEFMLNGSLEKFIFCEKNISTHQPLSWEKLQKISIGVARGIDYLHRGCKQRILHFDIKPHNILLDHNFQPKISDFGMAKLCSKEKSVVSMTAVRGTDGYIAPELYSRNFGEVSYKSDVFSYGMMLLEMVGCKKNTHVTTENHSQVHLPEWIYDRMSLGSEISLGIEEDGDEEIAKKLAIVGLWCIQWNPADRPSMTMVMQMLEDDLQSLEIPPKPFVSSDVENG